MQKYNIAQIGTFDVENYGDLLFPIVLEAELRKRIEIEEIYLFSPKGGKMPFSNKKVYPIEDLENIINTKNIDAIIIGGGDLIRLDKNVSGDYASDFKTSIKIWEYPILVGKKHKIPVLFNAMGVPYHFAKENYHILNKIFKSVDYLCVRDNISKDILDDIDKFDCHVVPDTINAISKIYSQEELSENLQRLKKEKIIPNIKDYIVIQHKIDGIDDEYYLNKIRNLIKYITTKEDKKVLLVPIGYVHNDIKFLEKVYDKDNKNIYFIKTKLSPYDMLSVFSQAKGFIGTSLHGLLTSNVYNVPILAINCGNLVKITGYLKLIGKEKLDVKDIECLLLVYKKDFDNQKKYDDKFIIKELNQHFDEIVCKIKENTSKQIENIELDILNEMYLNIEKAIEKENYENLYKISCGKCQQLQNELDRLLNSKSWRVTKPIRNITTKIARFKQQQKNNKLKVVNEKSKKLKQIKKKIAIHIHVFYPELLDEIYYNLSQMPYDYDCFISTTSKEKKKEIVNYFKNKKMENIVVEEFENKGRDILPFILQMKKEWTIMIIFVTFIQKKVNMQNMVMVGDSIYIIIYLVIMKIFRQYFMSLRIMKI